MTTDSGGRSGARVLYVDADDERAAPAVDALGDAGYAVDRARDAATACDAVATDLPACVVSEQVLPDGSGLELLEHVGETAEGVPFVLYTDSGDERLASAAISAGVTDYVPRDPPEKQRGALVDAVEAALADADRRFAGVTEALKDRAMDKAPVGITIAEGKRRDTPLIYVNEAFEELTGYDETEVVGRNCNLLQGPDSADEPVAEMAKAIDAGKSVRVELRNYRRDGEEFWNRVDIAPVENDAGEVTHYVGFQTDVTDRVEAEREARRQAEKARTERETVEALLDRIDGLVTNVTSGLLGADTRAAAEAAVTERLVETDEYALAWIGEAEPAADTIAPGTWAGVADPPALELAADGDDPAVRAVRTGEPQVIGADAVPGVYADALGGDTGGLAALPLRYGDVSYGVLVVVLRADAAFSEPEERLLAVVAQSTAMALHGLTSQRAARLGRRDRTGVLAVGRGAVLRRPVGCARRRVRPRGDCHARGRADDAVLRDGRRPDAVVEAAAARADIRDCTPVTSGDGHSVVEFTVAESPLVQLLVDRGGRIAAASASDGTGELTVEIPPEAQPRTVVDAVEDGVAGADLRAYREHERPAGTRTDVRARIDDRLTDRQSTALRTAVVGGFFEWPRETNGEDLAASMDIGRSTFHQHLRAAQRKVFEELYG